MYQNISHCLIPLDPWLFLAILFPIKKTHCILSFTLENKDDNIHKSEALKR